MNVLGGREGCDVAYNFIPCDRDQSFLMPPSLSDWLPEDHLAWFILDACSQMNLSAFKEKYRADGWGAKAFSPDMMVSLLLYAYCMGERSSRKIERACETDVAFRVMAANTRPDHSTIARFRRKNLKTTRKALHADIATVRRGRTREGRRRFR